MRWIGFGFPTVRYRRKPIIGGNVDVGSHDAIRCRSHPLVDARGRHLAVSPGSPTAIHAVGFRSRGVLRPTPPPADLGDHEEERSRGQEGDGEDQHRGKQVPRRGVETDQEDAGRDGGDAPR